MPSATIKLNVRSFCENTSPATPTPPPGPYIGIDTPTFGLNPGGQPLDGGGKVVITTESGESFIKVKGAGQGGVNGAMELVFQITSAVSGETYVPQAIVFANKEGTSTADLSAGAVDAANNTITANDTRATGRKSDGTLPQWEYYIQVRRASDLKLGWIDPGIENSDES